ncbi:MAG: diacylglycerol kinase family protein [Actinomycetota bacterium]
MPAERRPSAVLIVNHNAGRLPEAVRRDVVEAMRAHFSVEAISTTVRDAGIGLARDAAQAGADLIVAFGGDGIVNEVANGVARTDSSLGIIPGGTMNVFSRALGIPQDPFAAVQHMATALKRPARRVPLGQIDDRFFTFSAGCGFDAEAAERVERYLRSKRRFGQLFFYWSAFRVLARSFDLRNPIMVVKGTFGEVPVAMAITCNAGPYAYLAGRPVALAPDVHLERGVDIFALRRMRLEALPVYIWRVAVSGDLVHHPDVFYASDLDGFEIIATEPFHRHVDGEPLQPTSHARLSIVNDALNVRA